MFVGLLVVGLVVGGGIGYYMMPTKTNTVTQTQTVKEIPLKNQNVKIGYISPSQSGMETTKPYLQQINEPMMNDFAKAAGYGTTFTYLIDAGDGTVPGHLEKVQSMKSMGITVLQAGTYSSHAQGSLAYINTNKILMWSGSSTSPTLAIENDYLFRMCVSDAGQAPAIASMLWSHGVKYIVVIQRADAWADGIYNLFEPAYKNLGGTIIDRVRYASETTEYSQYLQRCEDLMKTAVEKYGKDRVALEVISFEESVVMATQAEDYPTLWDSYWFGSDGTSQQQPLIDSSPRQSAHLRFYSTLAAPANSEKYLALETQYRALTKQPAGYYTSCSNDAARVIAGTILQAQSSNGADIVGAQIQYAYELFGASGWCKLNPTGDRAAGNYQIWSYQDVSGQTQLVLVGYYDSVTGSTVWDTSKIGYSPIGP
jgi:branched-chain amino acid transport system substrate-binding protein